MAKPQTFGRLPNGSYFIVVDQNFPANLNRESAEIFRKLPTGIARDFDLAIKEVPRAEEPCLEGSPYSAYSIFIVNGHIYENSRMPATTKVLRLHDIVFYLFSKMELSRIDWSNITIPDMFLDLFSNQVSIGCINGLN